MASSHRQCECSAKSAQKAGTNRSAVQDEEGIFPAFCADAKRAKSALRKNMREQRRAWALQDNAYTLHSGFVQCSLLSHPLWGESSSILAYVSHQGEVDTSLVLQRAWAEGKQVFLPRCVPGKTGIMESVPCRSLENLRPGAYGIAEPIGPALPCPEKTLILVPGLAFDTMGYRLGYGGGFYDRFLFDKPNFITVGLAFSFQVVEKVPHESWDCPLHVLCTEETLQWI